MMGLTLQQVRSGDALPRLAIVISASRIVAGALASRDYSPLHHDASYAQLVGNQRDIFANTQFQAALFERFLQDWAGSLCRVARLKFSMRSSLYAGDEAVLTGIVRQAGPDMECGAGAIIDLSTEVGDRLATSCEALVGLPLDAADNPWARRGTDWLRP